MGGQPDVSFGIRINTMWKRPRPDKEIEMVDLGRDLWKERDALIEDLSRIVRVA